MAAALAQTTPSETGQDTALPHSVGGSSARAGSSVRTGRRRRIVFFFSAATAHFIWWDCIMQFFPLRLLRTPWLPRWQARTQKFKTLALDLGGIWIKFGQFLSTRVDVLPLEITHELESLRDEVPTDPVSEIIAQIEADFAKPLGEVFASFSSTPIGSASLAQVHRAHTLTGEPVVVKALRPGIRELIDADMALLRHVSRPLTWIRPITSRANVTALIDEFCAVTSNELAFDIEARNIERFA